MPLDADRLAAALTRRLGSPVRVEGLERLSGGASRETWRFDAVASAPRGGPAAERGGRHELVLRRDPGPRGAAGATGQSDRATEFGLLQAVHAAGVPVPAVRFLLDDADDLGRGFVMDRVAGETIARRILRDDAYAAARTGLAAQCGAVAAAIHAVDVASVPPLPVLSASVQLDQWRAALDGFGEPRPAFELGLQWLSARVPGDPPAPRLVHGDFRLGNFVVDGTGLRAVLDWELAHLGDPVEDLGWLCVKSWRFGNAADVVGGFGRLDDLLDAYAAVAGYRPSDDDVRWWCGLGTLKWGLITRVQAEAHLSGAVRSMELATLGRRIVEMEWDMLALVEGAW
jgi:aminoglycoside phosphotransferase (APT) family kinase protein